MFWCVNTERDGVRHRDREVYRCAHTHQDPLTIGYHGIVSVSESESVRVNEPLNH